MKKYLLLNLLCLFSIGSSLGQITYTSISFPAPGDILSIARAVDTLMTVTPPSATAQVWDFSALVETNTIEDTIQPASTGPDHSSFPTTDVLQPLAGNIGGTAYVDVTATKIERIGGGFGLLGISFVDNYINTHITQIVPTTYGDADADDYELAFGTHIDSVPFLRPLIDSALVGLPGGGAISPDSIRIALEGDDSRSVDAWGTCIMADSTYNVIRQKIISNFSMKIEMKMPFIGWLDVGSFLPIPLPENTTTVRYDFLAEGVKQPIVSLLLDSAETVITSIEFFNDTSIHNPPNTIDVRYLKDELAVNIFPNPAQKMVTVQVTADMPTEGYNLSIVDMLGRVVMVENAIVNENHQTDISTVGNGHYVVVLRDNSGKILKRQQLEIQR